MLVAEQTTRPLSGTIPTGNIRIALAGNPNSGKSTLFNVLTGLNQRTGNFPGVTVDRKSGYIRLSPTLSANLTDLPGAYSLHPKSLDEEITCRVLADQQDPDHPDLVLIVADATNIKRHLFLCTQLIDLGLPCILALNMIDQMESAGYFLDVPALSESLGIPVIPISARKNIGIQDLKDALVGPLLKSTKKFVDPELLIPDAVHAVATKTGLSPYGAYFFLNHPQLMASRVSGEAGLLLPEYEGTFHSGTVQARESVARYKAVTAALKSCMVPKPEGAPVTFTNKMDRILTHKIYGLFIFFAILFLIFQAVFTLSEPPMGWIESFFSQLAGKIAGAFPNSMIAEMVGYGIIQGLGGVLMFIPQIAILFGFLGVLEDTGYMARACYMMDRIMKKFGLNGRSVIPLVSGLACAVPAIMGTRTIGNWKERLSTILVIPFMSCSARLPVFILLISLVIPDQSFGGVFTLQGFVLFLLYLGGIVAALGTAIILKIFLKTKEKSLFIMEMPPYRLPRFRTVMLTLWQKIRVFVVDVGKIVVPLSVVLWVLASFGPSSHFERIEQKYSGVVGAESQMATEKLEYSYIGILGRQIEPLIEPLGMDWKMGISIITSFAAREVFVSTMATIYSVGEDTGTLRNKMKDQKRADGTPVYTLATGLSLLVFYLFALQCMSTIAVVKRETGGWKWPILQFSYMGILAWVGSFVIFRIFS